MNFILEADDLTQEFTDVGRDLYRISQTPLNELSRIDRNLLHTVYKTYTQDQLINLINSFTSSEQDTYTALMKLKKLYNIVSDEDQKLFGKIYAPLSSYHTNPNVRSMLTWKYLVNFYISFMQGFLSDPSGYNDKEDLEKVNSIYKILNDNPEFKHAVFDPTHYSKNAYIGPEPEKLFNKIVRSLNKPKNTAGEKLQSLSTDRARREVDQQRMRGAYSPSTVVSQTLSEPKYTPGIKTKGDISREKSAQSLRFTQPAQAKLNSQYKTVKSEYDLLQDLHRAYTQLFKNNGDKQELDDLKAQLQSLTAQYAADKKEYQSALDTIKAAEDEKKRQAARDEEIRKWEIENTRKKEQERQENLMMRFKSPEYELIRIKGTYPRDSSDYALYTEWAESNLLDLYLDENNKLYIVSSMPGRNSYLHNLLQNEFDSDAYEFVKK